LSHDYDNTALIEWSEEEVQSGSGPTTSILYFAQSIVSFARFGALGTDKTRSFRFCHLGSALKFSLGATLRMQGLETILLNHKRTKMPSV
jgi:hypothetical protein